MQVVSIYATTSCLTSCCKKNRLSLLPTNTAREQIARIILEKSYKRGRGLMKDKCLIYCTSKFKVVHAFSVQCMHRCMRSLNVEYLSRRRTKGRFRKTAADKKTKTKTGDKNLPKVTDNLP